MTAPSDSNGKMSFKAVRLMSLNAVQILDADVQHQAHSERPEFGVQRPDEMVGTVFAIPQDHT